MSPMENVIGQNNNTIESLEKMIIVSRRKLYELWDTRGQTDVDVLNASIELDVLLNLYQKQKIKSP